MVGELTSKILNIWVNTFHNELKLSTMGLNFQNHIIYDKYVINHTYISKIIVKMDDIMR